jgi:hypothetical protein
MTTVLRSTVCHSSKKGGAGGHPHIARVCAVCTALCCSSHTYSTGPGTCVLRIVLAKMCTNCILCGLPTNTSSSDDVGRRQALCQEAAGASAAQNPFARYAATASCESGYGIRPSSFHTTDVLPRCCCPAARFEPCVDTRPRTAHARAWLRVAGRLGTDHACARAPTCCTLSPSHCARACRDERFGCAVP